jgi:predicted Rossmann-fold nucleotide-binding protein
MAAICVFCASSRRLPRRWLDLADQAGRELGRRGHTLVSGGGCVDMMGTVAAGARAAGAHTLGVIPQSLVDLEVADRQADELIVTDGMAGRNDGFYAGLLAWLHGLAGQAFVHREALDRLVVVDTVPAALEEIEARLES